MSKSSRDSDDNNCYNIESREDFNVPQKIYSTLKKLKLNIKFAVEEDDYKHVLKENCFLDVDEVDLDFFGDYSDTIDHLIISLASSCPNVKKLNIRTEYRSTFTSFQTILSKCRSLEVFKFNSWDSCQKISTMMEEALPVICKNWPNLRYLELDDWKLTRKQGRYLILNSQNLQAVLGGTTLFVRSSAQMSEVATFFEDWGYDSGSVFEKLFVF